MAEKKNIDNLAFGWTLALLFGGCVVTGQWAALGYLTLGLACLCVLAAPAVYLDLRRERMARERAGGRR